MLGGSAQQVPAIEKAKEMGYYTVLIDYLPDNPGQYVADKWYQASTTDVEAVAEIAVKEGVSGILPYASDPAALPAAIVCERLGLPTNPAKSVEVLGIKHKFREYLSNNGFPSPKAVTFHPDTPIEEVIDKIEKLHFPIIVKPTDSSGSKGVSFLTDTEGIENAIKFAIPYSRNKILIAEEYIERKYPYVIGGDIFIDDGKVVVYGDTDTFRHNNGQGLIPLGECFPNHLNTEQRARLHAEIQRLVTALDLKAGQMNIELLMDKDDNPHFLELGPRAGGNMIPFQISDAFGVDLIAANVNAAMGLPTNLNPVAPEECFATYVLHSHQDGTFKEVRYSDEIEQYIYRKFYYKHPGDEVEEFDGAGKAIGIVFLKYPDIATMDRMCDEIDDHVKVILE